MAPVVILLLYRHVASQSTERFKLVIVRLLYVCKNTKPVVLTRSEVFLQCSMNYSHCFDQATVIELAYEATTTGLAL